MTAAAVLWHDSEHTIIRTEYSGTWTWDDFHVAVETAVDMMKTVNHRVDLIVAPNTNSVMPKGSADPHLRRAIQLLPTNFGIQVIVTRSAWSRTMASIFVKFFSKGSYKHRIFFVISVDEAYELILKDRVELPPKQSI